MENGASNGAGASGERRPEAGRKARKTSIKLTST